MEFITNTIQVIKKDLTKLTIEQPQKIKTLSVSFSKYFFCCSKRQLFQLSCRQSKFIWTNQETASMVQQICFKQ